MEFYDHPDCNTKLNPAEGDEESVAVLPVTQGKVGPNHEFDVTRSYWVPTEAELILLSTGRYCIALTVMGAHAPADSHGRLRCQGECLCSAGCDQ